MPGAVCKQQICSERATFQIGILSSPSFRDEMTTGERDATSAAAASWGAAVFCGPQDAATIIAASELCTSVTSPIILRIEALP